MSASLSPPFPGNTLSNSLVHLHHLCPHQQIWASTCSVPGTMGDRTASEDLCLPGASVHIKIREIPRTLCTYWARSFFGMKKTSIIPCGVFTEHRHSWLQNIVNLLVPNIPFLENCPPLRTKGRFFLHLSYYFHVFIVFVRSSSPWPTLNQNQICLAISFWMPFASLASLPSQSLDMPRNPPFLKPCSHSEYPVSRQIPFRNAIWESPVWMPSHMFSDPT